MFKESVVSVLPTSSGYAVWNNFYVSKIEPRMNVHNLGRF